MSINFPEIIPKFDAILERGLCCGVGTRDGQMCIEAAICAAMNLPHGDEPECVAASVRRFKIGLNDAKWSSPEARAAGLRSLGIAQIGSKGVVDDVHFVKLLEKKTIRVLIPTLFREIFPSNEQCLSAAERCETEGTTAAARWAAEAAAAARWAADADAARWAADADAARWAADADAARWAADADAARWAAEAADAARWAAAADDARWAAEAAAAADAARRAAEAADAAADARWAAAAARRAVAARRAAAAEADKYLLLSAKIALEVLVELKSPGCEWI